MLFLGVGGTPIVAKHAISHAGDVFVGAIGRPGLAAWRTALVARRVEATRAERSSAIDRLAHLDVELVIEHYVSRLGDVLDGRVARRILGCTCLTIFSILLF